MLGKFATVLGPILMGVVGKLTGSPRIGIFAIASLFLAGGFLLSRVTAPRKELMPEPQVT
jgi:MFS transporter, UMF1 family